MVTSAAAATATVLPVAERMARLLGVIPWVVSRGGAHLDEIATRFDYPREQLLEDLTERLFFVGVHPFTPDTLIEVEIDDGIVDIRYADWFSKPMRLDSNEATRLLAAGRAMLDIGGASSGDDDEAAPLVRALAKLSLSLGSQSAQASTQIDVCLGEAPAETLTQLRQAITEQRPIEIDYYSGGRDAMTSRTVDPARLVSHDGVWYLFGWCHRARADRVFRVERIRALTVTDSRFEGERAPGEPPTVSVDSVERTATIRLSADAAWAADYYPARSRTEHPDGSIDAVFAVAGEAWLARLLVQLGPRAQLIACDETIDSNLRAATAARMLQRYRQ